MLKKLETDHILPEVTERKLPYTAQRVGRYIEVSRDLLAVPKEADTELDMGRRRQEYAIY